MNNKIYGVMLLLVSVCGVGFGSAEDVEHYHAKIVEVAALENSDLLECVLAGGFSVLKTYEEEAVLVDTISKAVWNAVYYNRTKNVALLLEKAGDYYNPRKRLMGWVRHSSALEDAYYYDLWESLDLLLGHSVKHLDDEVAAEVVTEVLYHMVGDGYTESVAKILKRYGDFFDPRMAFPKDAMPNIRMTVQQRASHYSKSRRDMECLLVFYYAGLEDGVVYLEEACDRQKNRYKMGFPVDRIARYAIEELDRGKDPLPALNEYVRERPKWCSVDLVEEFVGEKE